MEIALEGHQEEKEPSVKSVDDEYPYDDDDFEDHDVESQLPMRVMEVTKEGWIFDVPFDDCCSYSNANNRDRLCCWFVSRKKSPSSGVLAWRFPV